jgi:cold shock protein
MNGRIKWYDGEKHYGFIRSAGHEKDIFVHSSQFSPGSTPVECDRVAFTLVEAERGPTAEKVTIIEHQRGLHHVRD